MMIGADVPSLILVFLFMLLVGWLIFRLARRLLTRTIKDATEKKVKLLATIISFVLSPLIVIGLIVLVLFVTIDMTEVNDEDIETEHYQAIEKDLSQDLKPGMTKVEVFRVFGWGDTTKSVMTYDLSPEEASGKYVIEIKFENGKLTGYERKK